MMLYDLAYMPIPITVSRKNMKVPMTRMTPYFCFLMTLTACSQPHLPEDDSRAGLLRPINGSGTTASQEDSTAAGRQIHDQLSTGSGYGGGTKTRHSISGPIIDSGLGGF